MKFKVNYSFGHRIFPENPNKSQKESNQIFCRYQKIVVGDFWTMMMVEWSATEVVEICCMAVNKYNADTGCDFIPNFYGIGIELNLICSHHKSELHSTRMQFNKQIEYRTMYDSLVMDPFNTTNQFFHEIKCTKITMVIWDKKWLNFDIKIKMERFENWDPIKNIPFCFVKITVIKINGRH